MYRDLQGRGLCTFNIRMRVQATSLDIGRFDGAFRDKAGSTLPLTGHNVRLFGRGCRFSRPLHSIKLHTVDLGPSAATRRVSVFNRDAGGARVRGVRSSL